MVHACDVSTWEAEAGGSLQVEPSPIYSEFKARLDCVVRACLKKVLHNLSSSRFIVTVLKSSSLMYFDFIWYRMREMVLYSFFCM